MKLTMAKWGVVIAAVLFGALSASVAEAGYKTEYAYCSKSADGSGMCYGTLLGFRNALGTSWASFTRVTADSYSYHQFSGSLNNQYYSCMPNAQLAAMWGDFMTARGRFQIEWNAAGQCTYGIVDNSSAYSNF